MSELTDAEYALLGLLIERPCHGYDLERLIEERNMREWTELAFSSIYFLLKKLEGKRLVKKYLPGKGEKSTRKIYAPTASGRKVHAKMSLGLIAEPRPTYPPVLLGLANWPSMKTSDALLALEKRKVHLARLLQEIQAKSVPDPAFIDVLFDYSISHISAELDWIDRSLARFGEAP